MVARSSLLKIDPVIACVPSPNGMFWFAANFVEAYCIVHWIRRSCPSPAHRETKVDLLYALIVITYDGEYSNFKPEHVILTQEIKIDGAKRKGRQGP